MGLTARAVWLSLVLALGFGFLVPTIDMKMRNTFLGATHLPPGAIAVLLVLLLAINPLLHLINRHPGRAQSVLSGLLGCVALSGLCYALSRTQSGALGSLATLGIWVFGVMAALVALTFALNTSRQPLSRNEILTVYISCLFSALAPGHGAENIFVVNMIGPFYYATRENKWLEFLEPSIKPWMTPALSQGGGYEKNDAARGLISGWYNGNLTGDVPWGAWLVPVFVWGAAVFLIYVMMACLCSMIRKQWSDYEALSFPLLRLPVELTEDVDKPSEGPFGRFFRNPLMWSGFGIAVFIRLFHGLNIYFPDVPTVPLDYNAYPLFVEAPWNQTGGLFVFVWPIAVGIAYLLTSEVSFSFWFFFLFIKIEFIVSYLLGFAPNSMPDPIGSLSGPSKSFTFYQSFGCLLAYVFLVLFTSRQHLKHIALRAFGRRRATADESEEALSHPLAFWGFFGSFGLLVIWSHAAGLNWPLALTLWSFYIVIIIGLTRIICEAGQLFVEPLWSPLGTLGQIFGAGPGHSVLSVASLPPATMIQGALMTDLRGFLMPSFIQGFKLAYDRKIALKPLLALVMVCSLLTFAMGTYFNIKFGYSQGGSSLDQVYADSASKQPVYAAQSLIKGVSTADPWNLSWVAVGGLMTYLFMLARARYAWFPLHPVGFMLAQTYPMNMLWFSMFLGWLAKVTITRYGGTDAYRKTTPLFLGLALGDVAMMLFWLVIDGWQGRIGHKLMPP